MKGGWFELGHYRDAPVRLHWTALVVPIVLSGFRIDLAYILGFVAMVFVHEVGHAYVSRRRKLRVVEIAIHGMGGHCRHERGSELDGQVIAWGGVLAQAWLSVAIRMLLWSEHAWDLGIVDDPWIAAQLASFVSMNEGIALFNLIPYKRLDGARAWPLLATVVRGRVPPLGRDFPTATKAPNEPADGPANRVVADLVASALVRASTEAREGQDSVS